MKCQTEGCEEEATIHVTKVINDTMTKIHLCAACAEKQGVDVSKPMKIEDLLDSPPSSSGRSRVLRQQCPTCGMQRRELKKGGRLGCAICYKTFSDDLNGMIKSMHHSDAHIGKVPVREGTRAVVKQRLSVLRRELTRAVTHEDFEEAAKLKTEIDGLEAQL